VLVVLNLEARSLKSVIADDYPNTMDEAIPISFGATIKGSLETSDDYDYFKFEVKNNDGIIINNAGNDNGNHPYIVLLNSNGTHLAKQMVSNSDTVASMNLNAGTYYIGVYFFADGTTNYHFDLKINGGETPTFVPDTATVAYCKKYPSKCGITNDTFKYTEADLTKSIADTKIYCKNNPAECGISSIKLLSETDISTLTSGWHLLGTSEEITDLSIFNSAKTVWSWDNGWKGYSSIPSLNEIFQNSAAINKLNKLESKRGFWILKE